MTDCQHEPARTVDQTRDAPPSTRRGRRGRGRRLTPRGRMLRTGVLTVLVLFAGWLAFSVGGALTAPGTDSTAARLAEWARTHHLGFVVTSLEQAQYAMNKPSTGGTVAGGIPTIGPASGPKTTPSSRRQKIAAPPAPIKPLAPSSLAREGQWQNLYSVKGGTAARVALLRPDTVHTSYLVNVVWMDPHLVKFKLLQGYQVPGGKQVAPNKLAGADLNNVLATFNSGFQMVDANGGYWQNGTTIKPLVKGAASMTMTKDGHLSVGAWPGGAPGKYVAAVRQNLRLMVQGGKISPLVTNPSRSVWGKTVGNASFVWRSGIGVRKDGTVVFVLGPAMDVQTLANVLQHAGAINAMELDINPDWTNYLTYTHPVAGKAVPQRLGNDSRPSLVRYLSPSTRDFVGVFGR
ncbi:MAG: phosphodiester glycosidase family protein [Actinomycetota bacterium]|nr:phosphodiester glycosidase family protein [Actinomycetota bacterium]